MRTLNLGILAHVDAGKTSLTERLLFAAGVIPKLGSVDAGNTQTDTLELERQRGITIRSAVVSFAIGGANVNLIDTPGHPDFIAEVERTLGVLDAAVVVVSAVEGVQAQTRVLVRALQRLGVPFVFFINKVDRLGANYANTIKALREQLPVRPLAMSSVTEAGSKSAMVAVLDPADDPFRALLREALAENDEALLEDYLLAPERLTVERMHQALAGQVGRGLLHPAFAGSAATGVGLSTLMEAIETLLPAQEADPDGPVAGRIFKIERGWGGEKQAYLALTSGTIALRHMLDLPQGEARITGIKVFEAGKLMPATTLKAGQIGRISGLGDAVIGDLVGAGAGHDERVHFAPPTLEARVLPCHKADNAALWTALSQLAEQDPLINLRHDEEAGEIFVSLYGEVQKEVIQSTLALDFGLEVVFLESTVICVERVLGMGEALDEVFRGGNPFVATVGLRVEPRPAGTGNSFALDVSLGLMPTGFYRAIEETVHEVLRQGVSGWQVIDCHVTVTKAGQKAPMTAAADFRQLTPLVLAAALAEAKTVVCEPVSRFYLDLPASMVGAMVTALAQVGAVVTDTAIDESMARLEGTIAAAMVHAMQQQLPGLTGGAGAMECVFDHYAPISGTARTRIRSGPDPFHRMDYLIALRRLPG